MKFFISLFFILLITKYSPANANDYYSVQNIKIDVSDDSILNARNQAILQAEKKAFDTLVNRLIEPNRKKGNLNISDSDLLSLIEDFEIQEEKNSTTRYMGIFTIRFKNEEVDRYLTRQGNILKTEENDNVTLIVPIYQKDQTLEIWQESNPWLQAWKEKQIFDPHHILAFGDLRDREIVSFVNLQKNNFSSFTDLMKRYQAQRLLIVILKQQNPYCMDVFFYNSKGNEFKKRFIFQKENYLTELLISKAMQNALEAEKNFIEKKNQANSGYHKILTNIKFHKFSDWQSFKKTISTINVIQKFDLLSLKHTEAQILLYSLLEINSLKNFFSQLGFSILKESTMTHQLQIDISEKESLN